MPQALDHPRGAMPDETPSFLIRPELPGDADAIEALAARAFGPGRFARTAFRVREAAGEAAGVTFVATSSTGFAGSVRLTPIRVGPSAAFLLGPLAVEPALAGRGIGRALLARAILAGEESGRDAILLVGDLAYYGPSGFRRVDPAAVRLPGPVEAHRLLAHPLRRFPVERLSGPVRPDGPARGD